ncbi:NAD(P)-dependent dehydrogenase (short-subunit alcohol dehydrogenase family) [Pseudacidovorax sp. 1753]|uniref:SDR family NAD(P)-dependent oxidoreductase n=1 Tax=Pseudacidovorax sp. 1753 TaxID=3156419 RepID=UPI003392C410
MGDFISLDGEALQFEGKCALVTSTANETGFQIADMLVKADATVYLVNRDQRECSMQVEALRRSGKAKGYAVNLQDPLTLSHFLHLLNEEISKLHILVSVERLARIAQSSSSDFALRAREQLQGELDLIQELIPSLHAGSTAVDPARVILIGDFAGLRLSQVPLRHGALPRTESSTATEIAQQFVEHRINLNFVDLAPPYIAAGASHASPLLACVRQLTSIRTAHTRGEVQSVAPAGYGDANGLA